MTDMRRPEPFGCSDHNCIIRQRESGGMGTNGGCRCQPTHLLPDDRVRLKAWIRWLVEKNERLNYRVNVLADACDDLEVQLAEVEARFCTHNATVAVVAAAHSRRD